MISRIWHGWTSKANADAYQTLLTTKILPGIHRVAGFRGATLLRRDAGAEVEFVTIMLFESMDAVRTFAGADYEIAVVPPKASALLARFEEQSKHYETVLTAQP